MKTQCLKFTFFIIMLCNPLIAISEPSKVVKNSEVHTDIQTHNIHKEQDLKKFVSNYYVNFYNNRFNVKNLIQDQLVEKFEYCVNDNCSLTQSNEQLIKQISLHRHTLLKDKAYISGLTINEHNNTIDSKYLLTTYHRGKPTTFFVSDSWFYNDKHKFTKVIKTFKTITVASNLKKNRMQYQKIIGDFYQSFFNKNIQTKTLAKKYFSTPFTYCSNYQCTTSYSLQELSNEIAKERKVFMDKKTSIISKSISIHENDITSMFLVNKIIDGKKTKFKITDIWSMDSNKKLISLNQHIINQKYAKSIGFSSINSRLTHFAQNYFEQFYNPSVKSNLLSNYFYADDVSICKKDGCQTVEASKKLVDQIVKERNLLFDNMTQGVIQSITTKKNYVKTIILNTKVENNKKVKSLVTYTWVVNDNLKIEKVSITTIVQ
ncbi:hypothetical protein [Paraphotobacterium marinum]|uniref:hypothetical protein n=1 Tax=Paraphotobacterium marinum TaxID=1755811 RepID=UPI0039E7B006